MKMKSLIFIFLWLILLTGCDKSEADDYNNVENSRMISKEITEKVKSYISKNKGWKASLYTIEYKRKEGGMDVYWVVHVDDLKTEVPSNPSKSIELYLDPVSLDIVKEMAFQ